MFDFHSVEASNKKLLLEVEESIETQLDNAERRVSSVHQVSILHSQSGEHYRSYTLG